MEITTGPAAKQIMAISERFNRLSSFIEGPERKSKHSKARGLRCEARYKKRRAGRKAERQARRVNR